MRICFEVSYLGAHFFGSQQQPFKRTVMGEITRSLKELNLFESEEDAKTAISGRTDRGVSARRQIIAFNTDYPERAVSASNKKLPPDIRFTGWSEVPDGFNPRFAAKTRTYRYYFPADTLGISYSPERMKKAACLFKGKHDFSSFSRTEGKDPKREIISSEIITEPGFVIYEICGYSFLWNMVRCIAFCLELAGKGELSFDEIKCALENPCGNRFPAAPPQGLILWDVDCGVDFISMNIHEKSVVYSKEKIHEYSQLKKISEIW